MTWVKGQSGNPRGAPKRGMSFTEIIAAELGEIDPRSGLPYRVAIVRAMAKLAVSGDPHALEAARWLADRSDGKVAQAINVNQEQTVHVVPWLAAEPGTTWRPLGHGGEIAEGVEMVDAVEITEMVDAAALPGDEDGGGGGGDTE